MRDPFAQNLRILPELGGDAEIRAWRHVFPDWHELIPSRAGKRTLCGNPQAPAKPAPAIETNAALNVFTSIYGVPTCGMAVLKHTPTLISPSSPIPDNK
jgi:hypothetical protein